MITKILMLASIPVLIAVSMFFTGGQNILDYLDFPWSSVETVLQQFANMITLVCRILDNFLVTGTAMMLLKFWFLMQMAVIVWKIIRRVLNMIR